MSLQKDNVLKIDPQQHNNNNNNNNNLTSVLFFFSSWSTNPTAISQILHSISFLGEVAAAAEAFPLLLVQSSNAVHTSSGF